MDAIPKRLCLIVLLMAGCGKWADELFCPAAGCAWSPGEWDRVASLANPGPPPPDSSNVLVGDPGAEALGRMFFFDPAFSGAPTQLDAIDRPSPPARPAPNGTINISCATCHDLAHGGVDITSVPGHVSVGAGWTDVNALSVMNSAFRNVVFWNGRADSLWALNAIVAESKTTLGGNRLRTAHQLVGRYRDQLIANGGGWLVGQFQNQFPGIDCSGIDDLFGRIATAPADGRPGNGACVPTVAGEPFADAFDCLDADVQKAITTLLVIWAKAIAAYEYKLISAPSDFDRYMQDGPGSTRISAAAQRGARLFVGKAACVDCHSGPQLTDEMFHDIGIPQTGIAVPTTADCPASDSPRKSSCDCVSDTALKCAPWGAYDGLRRLQETDATSPIFNKWLRTRTWSDDKMDTSRDAYVQMPLDGLKGAWRTPSLRNVALTAPYMHDGRYATLQDVIWHYNTGGKTAGPEQVGHLAPEIKPLLLTDAEQADLIAFLESLTGALPDADALPEQKFTTRPALPASDATSTVSLCAAPPPTGGGGAGGSGGNPTGSAGSGTGPGSTGTGGTAGSIGPPPPYLCTTSPVAMPLITNFSEARPVGAAVYFGNPPVSGQIVGTAPPGAVAPFVSLSSAPSVSGLPALGASGKPIGGGDAGDSWLGVNAIFDNCVNVPTGVNAVRFTLNNSNPNAANCPLFFAVVSRQNVANTDDPRGTCTGSSCEPPFAAIPLTSGQISMPFSTGLGPGQIDLGNIIGLRWRSDASCGLEFNIDDILFANQ